MGLLIAFGIVKATVLLLPYGPDGMSQVAEQIAAALLTSTEADRRIGTANPSDRPAGRETPQS